MLLKHGDDRMNNQQHQTVLSLEDDIVKEATEYLEEKHSSKKWDFMMHSHTLYHELGHATDGIACELEFILIRVGHFVYYINAEGERKHLVMDGPGAEMFNKGSKGVCFVYDSKGMSKNDLRGAFLNAINGGPKGTSEYVSSQISGDCNKKEKRMLKKFLRLNPGVLMNESGVKDYIFFWSQVIDNHYKTNDQSLITKLLGRKGEDEAVEINNRFKAVRDAIHGDKAALKKLDPKTTIIVEHILRNES